MVTPAERAAVRMSGSRSFSSEPARMWRAAGVGAAVGEAVGDAGALELEPPEQAARRAAERLAIQHAMGNRQALGDRAG